VEQPAQATTPGKNGLIVFSADTGAGHQLYTIKPNGRGLRQLTNLNGDAVAADWSPYGRRITFELGTETHAGVMIMNADGSGLRDLTPTGFQGQPAFTPDCHHLVYECGDCPGGQGIFIIRDDGTGRRRLTTNPSPTRASTPIPTSPPTARPSPSSAPRCPRSCRPCTRSTSTAPTSASSPLQP
jgi:Tol biopolymer transport system component